MHKINDPRQKRLFDPFDNYISAKAREYLLKNWQGVFRYIILELMPVDIISGVFSSKSGAPTKELYSMAGLLVIKEFENWTTREAAEAYMFRNDIQYALNLSSTSQSLNTRTIERYQKIFRDNDVAAQVMHEVTLRLSQELEIDLEKQRLDSTHVNSDMAVFGRTRMMGVSVKRFLIQLKRHNTKVYMGLPQELRRRYEPSTHQMFADVKRTKTAYRLLREQVAEDMHYLIAKFEADERWLKRSTYQLMERVFNEQCEIVGDKVEVRKKTGGDVIQNTSDPDATYDGHKGSGYHVQLAETCSEENEVELVTSAIPQTAVEHDSDAVDLVLDDLEKRDAVPEQMYADTTYCSDENVDKAADKDVELVGPVVGKKESEEDNSKLNIDDFVVDESDETIKSCPAGNAVDSSEHDEVTGKTVTIMPESACGNCEYQHECPIQKVKGQYRIIHTAKERRLAERRREEDTDVFRERYKIRGGIEGTNSGIKRRTGMSRLRVRGKPAVCNAILLKVTGWNILRASTSQKLQAKVAALAAAAFVYSDFRSFVAPISSRILIFSRKADFTANRMLRLPDFNFYDNALAA